MYKTLLRLEQRFGLAGVTGLPNLTAGGYPPHLLQVVRPVYPFWVRSVGGGSCRGLLFLANRYSAAGTSLAPY
jgi:hypothetical protein